VQIGADHARQIGATFDAKAADDCLTALRNQTMQCKPTSEDPVFAAACGRVWVGSKAPGAACKEDLECGPPIPNATPKCYGASLDGSATGTCVNLTSGAKEGDVCAVAMGAAPPQNLANCAASNLQCGLSLKCEPLAAIGAKCPGFTVCAKGAYCDASGTCAATLSAGTACMENKQCASGQCIAGKCGANSVGGSKPCTGM
jgi:hypothetical protein